MAYKCKGWRRLHNHFSSVTNVPVMSPSTPWEVGGFAFYDGANWINGGKIVGPKGDQGLKGATGAMVADYVALKDFKDQGC